MSKTHAAEFYVQVQRKKHAQWRNGKSITASAIKMTQEKPATTPKDTVVVKLKVELPDDAFEPFEPSAVIAVPQSMILQQPTTVIVEDPS